MGQGQPGGRSYNNARLRHSWSHAESNEKERYERERRDHINEAGVIDEVFRRTPLTNYLEQELLTFNFMRTNRGPGSVANVPEFVAKRAPRLEEVKRIFDRHDFDVNEHAQGGLTALHYAVLLDDIELCAYLLKKGPALESPDIKGHSPFRTLMDSTAQRKVSLPSLSSLSSTPAENSIHYLLASKGASPNNKDVHGRTVFHAALEAHAETSSQSTTTAGGAAAQVSSPEKHVVAFLLQLGKPKRVASSGGNSGGTRESRIVSTAAGEGVATNRSTLGSSSSTPAPSSSTTAPVSRTSDLVLGEKPRKALLGDQKNNEAYRLSATYYSMRVTFATPPKSATSLGNLTSSSISAARGASASGDQHNYEVPVKLVSVARGTPSVSQDGRRTPFSLLQALKDEPVVEGNLSTLHSAAKLTDSGFMLDKILRYLYFNMQVATPGTPSLVVESQSYISQPTCLTAIGAAVSKNIAIEACCGVTLSFITTSEAVLWRLEDKQQPKTHLDPSQGSNLRKKKKKGAVEGGSSASAVELDMMGMREGSAEASSSKTPTTTKLKIAPSLTISQLEKTPGGTAPYCMECLGKDDVLFLDIMTEGTQRTPLAECASASSRSKFYLGVELVLTLRTYLMLHNEMLL